VGEEVSAVEWAKAHLRRAERHPMVTLSREKFAKMGGLPLDPALGAASIRLAVSDLKGDS
jgi:hypothetical protein